MDLLLEYGSQLAPLSSKLNALDFNQAIELVKQLEERMTDSFSILNSDRDGIVNISARQSAFISLIAKVVISKQIDLSDLKLYIKESLLPVVFLAIIQLPNIASNLAREALLQYHVCILKLNQFVHPRTQESVTYIRSAILYYERKAMESPNVSDVYKCTCLALDLCEFYFLTGDYKEAGVHIHRCMTWVQDVKQLLNIPDFAHLEQERIHRNILVLMPFMPVDIQNQIQNTPIVQSDWFITVYYSLNESVFDSPCLLNLFKREVCKEPKIPFKIKEYIFFRAASCQKIEEAATLALFATLSHTKCLDMKACTRPYMISWYKSVPQVIESLLNELKTLPGLTLENYKQMDAHKNFIFKRMSLNLMGNADLNDEEIDIDDVYKNEEWFIRRISKESPRNFKTRLFESFYPYSTENAEKNGLQDVHGDRDQRIINDYIGSFNLGMESAYKYLIQQGKFLLDTQQYALGVQVLGVAMEKLTNPPRSLGRLHYECLLKEDFQFMETYIAELGLPNVGNLAHFCQSLIRKDLQEMNESKHIFQNLIQFAKDRQDHCHLVINAYSGLNDMLHFLLSHGLSYNQTLPPLNRSPNLISGVQSSAHALFMMCINSQETAEYFLETSNSDYLYFIGSLLVGVLSSKQEYDFTRFAWFGMYSELSCTPFHTLGQSTPHHSPSELGQVAKFLSRLYLKIIETDKQPCYYFCCGEIEYYRGNYKSAVCFYTDGLALLSRHFTQLSCIRDLARDIPLFYDRIINACRPCHLHAFAAFLYQFCPTIPYPDAFSEISEHFESSLDIPIVDKRNGFTCFLDVILLEHAILLADSKDVTFLTAFMAKPEYSQFDPVKRNVFVDQVCSFYFKKFMTLLV